MSRHYHPPHVVPSPVRSSSLHPANTTLSERITTPYPLSLTALACLDHAHPANPRSTVQYYLSTLPPQLPPKDERRQSPPRSPLRTTNRMLNDNSHSHSPSSPAAPHRSTKREGVPSSESDDRRGGEQRAMTIGGVDKRKATTNQSSRIQPMQEKVRPNLVARMKPRTSIAQAVRGGNGTAGAGKGVSSSGKAIEPERRQSTSSPLLTSRRDADASKRGHQEKENRSINVAATVRKKRKSEAQEIGYEDEEEGVIVFQTKRINRDQNRDAESENEEDEERTERLAARKERRRSKALIVKDRTVSAAATGTAAASKLKKSRRASTRSKPGDEEEEDNEAVPSASKRGKRKSVEETNRTLQAIPKAKNVTDARLTLKPRTQLGLFSKGVASVRTIVGHRLPDLAFSELDFLNAPRRDPKPNLESAFSSNSNDSPPPQKSRKVSGDIISYLETAGALKGKRSASKYFEEREGDLLHPVVRRPISPLPIASTSKFIEPPRVPTPMTDTTASAHSAHSLALRKGYSKERVEDMKDRRRAFREDDNTIIDTTTAWAPLSPRKSVILPLPASASAHPAVSAQPSFNGTASFSRFPSPPLPSAVDDHRHSSSARIDRLIRACDTGEWNESISLGGGNDSRDASFGFDPSRDERRNDVPNAAMDWEEEEAFRGSKARRDEDFDDGVSEAERIFTLYDENSMSLPLHSMEEEEEEQGDESREEYNESSNIAWCGGDLDEGPQRPSLDTDRSKSMYASTGGMIGPFQADASFSNESSEFNTGGEGGRFDPNDDRQRATHGFLQDNHLSMTSRFKQGGEEEGGRSGSYLPTVGRQFFAGQAEFASAMKSHWYPSKC